MWLDVANFVDQDAATISETYVLGPGNMAKPVKRMIPLNADTGWLFGLFAAEGCADLKQIRISCDEKTLDRAERILTAHFEVHCGRIKQQGADVLSVARSILTPLFQTFGHLAENKIVPEWVFGANTEFRRAFVEGLADGDGHTHEGRTQITSTSRSLVWQTRLLLAGLGVGAVVSLSKAAGERNICGKDAKCLDAWVVDFKSNFGQNGSAVWTDDHVGYWIEHNERIDGEVEVFNLAVEEDESYVTTGGTFHNCTMAWTYLRQAWMVDLEEEEEELDRERQQEADEETVDADEAVYG